MLKERYCCCGAEKVWVVELAAEYSLSQELAAVLGTAPQFQVVVHPNLPEHVPLPAEGGPRAVFLIVPPESAVSAREALCNTRREAEGVPVLLVAETAAPEEVYSLLELGAADFLTPPIRSANVLPRLWRCLEHRKQPDPVVHGLKQKLGLRHLVGESEAFVELIRKIPLVAGCDASVLICGETGTGKELCARAVHYLSPRSAKPFVAVNCGALPLDLVENELFGHERSAYTGAGGPQPGLVAEADGGTLFLDEIDTLLPSAQVKLLRFLQEKEYRPLGSPKLRRADVRVLAATNVDPEQAVDDGRLRRDLYYRVATIPLELPPLRERSEDVPLLTQHFLRKFRERFERRRVDSVSPSAMQKLLDYDWPGNVRELENVVERAVVLCDGKRTIGIGEVQLPRGAPKAESFRDAKARVVERFERRYLKQMLIAHGGNISHAATAAKKNRRAFWELIRKHGIDARQFRR